MGGEGRVDLCLAPHVLLVDGVAWEHTKSRKQTRGRRSIGKKRQNTKHKTTHSGLARPEQASKHASKTSRRGPRPRSVIYSNPTLLPTYGLLPRKYYSSRSFGSLSCSDCFKQGMCCLLCQAASLLQECMPPFLDGSGQKPSFYAVVPTVEK